MSNPASVPGNNDGAVHFPKGGTIVRAARRLKARVTDGHCLPGSTSKPLQNEFLCIRRNDPLQLEIGALFAGVAVLFALSGAALSLTRYGRIA